mmetsp:Transcript_32013/g.75045  ORF Transcript_32013/g.75045 Transcript_32013/m.75045 type:complete len:172 (+) Transcript_32013:58-573(+)
MPAALTLPSDPEVLSKLEEACKLAEQDDIKAAQQLLKQVVASGAIPSSTQRQVVALWANGTYVLPGIGNTQAPTRPEPLVKADVTGFEAQVTQVMRDRGMSRKSAVEFIEQGGLEMEQMQMEMNHPMDETFRKIKEQGPPQWFIDACKEVEEKRQAAEVGELAPEPAPCVD